MSKYVLSWDFDIADVAASAVYNLCLSSCSMMSYASTEFELKDNLELPQSLGSYTLAVFEGLGFLSADYGIVDFVKGHIVPPYGLTDEEMRVVVVNKSEESSSSPTLRNVMIPLSQWSESTMLSWANEADYSRIVDIITRYQSTNELSSSQFSTILNVLRAASVLHGTMSSRVKIVLLRLKCFFILIHCRLPIESMQSYISSGCAFLKDLVALSDLNSEISSELKQAGLNHIEIANVSCECLVAMLSLVTRRRGVLLQQSGILQDLGLRQSVIRGGRRDELNGNLSHEVAWISIISSSYNTIINLLHSKSLLGKQHFSFESNLLQDFWKNYNHNINTIFELFVLCVSSSESHMITQMTPLILSQANVIRFALPHLSYAFHAEDPQEVPACRIIAKSLSSIEFVLEKMASRGQPSPVSILQDCDFMATLQSLFEVVDEGLKSSQQTSLIFLTSLLTQTFSFMSRYLKMNRRRMVSASDAGIHLIQQPSFASICEKIFSSACECNELMWNELLLLLKEAVDIDPPFHAYLLSSSYFNAVVNRLKLMSISEPNAMIHELAYSLSRLIRVICISNEAQDFIYRHQLLELIINISISNMSVLPNSPGLTVEIFGLIGKTIVTTMRDVEKLRDSVLKHMDALLINTCKEAQLIWDTKVNFGEIPTIISPRMQVLQKLTNICSLEESFHTEMRRVSSGSREAFSETKLSALVAAYTCTLPPSRQLLAQLGTRQAIQSTHFGHTASAKAITTLLKSAASSTPQTLLPIILKAIETTLIKISTQKQALRGGIYAKEPALDFDMFTMESIQKARKQRSRGSSLGEESGDVFILGVLDALPHRCSFDPSIEEEFSKDSDLEKSTWKFLSAILNLEWLTFILSYTLRPSPYLHIRQSDKDILRRLFAFHKSSMMEVCRFSSSKYKAKPLADVHKSQSLGDSLAEYDSSEDEVPILRVPGSYSLRVVSSVGALLREDCEIEGSRVVLLANNGTICTAYERSQTNHGVVRYRTAHGWMSEYRKDSQSEILELIDVGLDASGSGHFSQKSSVEKQEDRGTRRLKEMMTVRESACYALTRINVTLRIVAMHLSHSVVTYQSRSSRGRRDADTLSPLAGTVSKVLAKIVRGLLTYPFECLREEESPTCLEEFARHSNMKSAIAIRDQSASKSLPLAKKSSSSSSRRGSKSNSKMLGSSENFESPRSNMLMLLSSSDKNAETISVNKASVCLYFESVAKYILIPILEDRNGNLNTHLLKYLQIYGGFDLIVESLLFAMACYYESSSDAPNLSASSQAALRALPSIMVVIRKLTQPKGIIQSQITASMKSSPIPEKVNNDIYDLIHFVYSALSDKLIPILYRKLISQFPGDIQLEFYTIVMELRYNLEAKLPPPEVDTTASRLPNSLSDWESQPSTSSYLTAIENAFSDRNPMPRDLRRRNDGGESVSTSYPATAASAIPEARLQIDAAPNQSQSQADSAIEPVIQLCQDMGFNRAQVLQAHQETQSTNVEALMEYMFVNTARLAQANITEVSNLRHLHPEISEDDLAAASDDPELLAALQMSVANLAVAESAPASSEADLPTAEIVVSSESSNQLTDDDVIDVINAAGAIAMETEDSSNVVENTNNVSSTSDADSSLAVSPATHRLQASTSLQRILRRTIPSLPAAPDISSPISNDALIFPNFPTRPPMPVPYFPPRQYPRLERTDRVERSVSDTSSNSSRSSIGKAIELTPGQSDLTADYFAKEADLKAYLNSMHAELIVDNIVSSSKGAIETLLTRGDGMPFIAALFQIIKKFLAESVPIIFRKLLDESTSYLTKAVDDVLSSSPLYGLLNMVLCFLRNTSTRSQVNVSKTIALELYHRLSLALKHFASADFNEWPSWTSVGLVVLYDLLSSIVAHGEVKTTIPHAINDSKEDESKVEDVLIEEKQDDTILSDLKEAAVSQPDPPMDDASEWISNQIRDMDLLPRSVWMEVYQIVDTMTVNLSSFSEKEGQSLKAYQKEIHQSIMLVLTLVITDEAIRHLSVEQNILRKIIRIPKEFSNKDNQTLLSMFVQLQLKSDEIVRHDFHQDLTTFLKSSSEKKPLNDFIQNVRTSSYIKSHPNIISETILKVCEFYEVKPSSESAQTGVFVRLRASADEKMYENLSYELNQSIIMLELLSRIYQKSDDLFLYTSADILHVICDVLSSDSFRIGNTFSRLITLDSSKILSTDSMTRTPTSSIKLCKGKSTLIDFLVDNFFGAKGPTLSPAKGLLPTTTLPDVVEDSVMAGNRASARFILMLASCGGILRKILLNTLVRSIKTYSRPSSSETDEEIRLRVLSRLASFLPMIFKYVKTEDSGTPDNKSAVSVDILVQLFHAGIAETLTEALAFIPLRHSLSSDAINAILEPLEIFSRPQFQNLIQEQIEKRDALQSTASEEMESISATNTNAEMNRLMAGSLHADGYATATNTNIPRSNFNFLAVDNDSAAVNQRFFSSIVAELQDAMHNYNNGNNMHGGDDDDSSDEDDEDHDAEEDDDEDDNAEDGHNVVLDDENGDDEGEDDDDDDDDGHHMDEFVVFDNHQGREDNSTNMSRANRDYSEFVVHRYNAPNTRGTWQIVGRNGVNDAEPNSFVTPPDRIRVDPLQVLLTELNSDRIADSPEEMIRRLIRESENLGLSQDIPDLSFMSTDRRYDEQVSYRRAVSGGSESSQLIPSSLHPLLAGTDHMDSNSNPHTQRSANVNGAETAASIYAARYPYPRMPNMLQRQNAIILPTASVGIGDRLSMFMDQYDRDASVSTDNLPHEDRSSTHDPVWAPNDDRSRPSDSFADATARPLVVADCFASSLASAISRLVVQLPAEPAQPMQDVSAAAQDSAASVDHAIANPTIEESSPNQHSSESGEGSQQQTPSVSASPPIVPDESESQDDISEMTRTVGDLHTVGSVSESIGDSYAGSYATEARSYQDTVGESMMSAGNLTSDAIPGRYDYDNVSMLSSIPTSESDDDDSDDDNDEQDNVTIGNTVSSPVFDLLPSILEEDQQFNPDEEDDSDDDDSDANEDIPVEVPEDNLIIEVGDVIIVEGSQTEVVELVAEAAAADASEPQTTSSRLECPQGYDRDVFDSLPENMQQEIVDQYSQTNTRTRQLIENAGYDFEMFTSLPESIQQEILEQARRDQQPAAAAASATAATDDNASFLLSLTPDLRADILLTAEPAFLESLPLQLQAEAQNYRDQAARRIQEREIVRSERNVSRENFDPVVDMEDQYAEDDAPARRLMVSGNQLRSSISGGGRSTSSLPPDGLFRIPNDDVPTLSLPLRLLAVVTKVLCSTTVKINVTLLQQLLFNLSKHAFTRDVSLRLLISLLANDAEMFKTCLTKLDISPTAAEAVYHLLLQSSDAFLLNNSLGCSLRRPQPKIISNFGEMPASSSSLASRSVESPDEMLLFGGSNIADSATATAWTIPRHTLQSLIALLGQLFTTNPSTVYDILRPRTSHGGDVQIDLSSTSNASANAHEANDSAKAVPMVMIPDAHPSTSTNSLLEVLISLLSVDELSSNSTDLAALTNLIAKSSTPLDIAIRNQHRSAEELEKELKDKEEQIKAKGYTAVAVPAVVISRQALMNLCDILLSDMCSQRVFSDVTTIISRLTVTPANREVLLTLLVSVAEDLTEQSTSKLRALSTTLNQIHQDNNPIVKIASPKATLQSPTNLATSKAHSNLSLIPTFELGGRQHDHLLRTLQTLVVIAIKNRQDLNEVISISSMVPLWQCLDEVLGYLREYVGNEEAEDGSEEKEAAEPSSSTAASAAAAGSANRARNSSSSAPASSISPTNSSSHPATASLIFILTRLLPAIQSFFVVLTQDLLYSVDDEEDSSNKKTSPVPHATATEAVSSQGNPSSTEAPTTSATGGAGNMFIPVTNILGGRHRQTRSYLRMNINLYPDAAMTLGSPIHEDHAAAATPLQRARSMQRSNLSAVSAHSSVASRSHRLQSFALTHKKLLNLLVKSQPALLEKSLSSLIRVVQLRPYLSFENKRKYFLQQLHASRRGPVFSSIHLRIRRESVFEDSYEQLRSRSAEEWLGRFQIDFHGEQGIDAGGLTREFYSVLSREIFNPNYALFDAAADGATFQPNPSSNINSNHLSYFKFIGNVIGKAICDGHLMDAHFTRSFYKHVLGIPVDYADIEATEPDYYKTLKQILDNPLEVLMIDLTFTAETHNFGKVEVSEVVIDSCHCSLQIDDQSAAVGGGLDP
jgi:hypothetical protein